MSDATRQTVLFQDLLRKPTLSDLCDSNSLTLRPIQISPPSAFSLAPVRPFTCPEVDFSRRLETMGTRKKEAAMNLQDQLFRNGGIGGCASRT